AIAGDIKIATRATTHVGYFHPGICGELVLGNDVIGWFGEYHPDTRKKLGVDGPVFGFDLDLTRLPIAPPAQMHAIPRFPGSARDVSLLLATAITAGRVAEVIEQTNERLVSSVRLLEDYRDPKLGDGMKSMLWSILYRAPDRTLTDAEIDKAHENIVTRLVENLPAQRR
ncbi:MAG TPA: hypothetical protein VK427_00590, partial [Kofleriaceae bacterium]|nr:hypothetical protein [Kofleriaceae bacterium]